VDVVATQSSSSAPVEVSWSPPSDAAPAIIGYKIFYGDGQNLFIPSYVTRIVLNFVDSSQIESVSIRSESTQLPSELITATVTIAGKLYQNKY
jgi:Na+-translocating ferredoxin:NAD+ oxidoreductase RnfD subunit